MTLSLYNCNYGVQSILQWYPTEKQWWVTGFNPQNLREEVDVHKQVMICRIDLSENVDMYDALFEAAITLDAEDIVDEEGEYKVYTSIPNFQTVVEGLEQAGFKSVSAEFTRVPQNTIEVTDEKTAQNIIRLLGRLEEHDDVQNVYANFDIDDELMEKLEG